MTWRMECAQAMKRASANAMAGETMLERGYSWSVERASQYFHKASLASAEAAALMPECYTITRTTLAREAAALLELANLLAIPESHRVIN